MTSLTSHCGFINFNGLEQLLEFGLPIKRGVLGRDNFNVTFTVDDKKVEFSEVTVISRWSCGSIKWLHVRMICNHEGVLKLISHKNEQFPSYPLTEVNNSKWLGLEFADQKVYKIQSDRRKQRTNNENTFSTDKLICLNPADLSFHPNLKFKNSDQPAKLKIIQTQVKKSALLHRLKIDYEAKYNQSVFALTIEASFSSISNEIYVSVKAHNTNAAQHQGNTWDLGDENSIYIDDFSLTFDSSIKSKILMINEETDDANSSTSFFNDSPFLLQQSSSGGPNYNSPVHWDENKTSTVKKHGYSLSIEDEIVKEGLRASPLVGLDDEDKQIIIEMKDFWQNFPTSIQGDDSNIQFKLLQSKTELQGGESKTWNFKISLLRHDKSVKDSLRCVKDSFVRFLPSASYLDDTLVFPHIRMTGAVNCLSYLINNGIVGDKNFYSKRESIDEYGWRNYGELYADHEVTTDFNGDYFVSHYNNQYDPLLGMTLQYIISANKAWLELLIPLSQHIQDIDIYDTELDKAEYNGGLMWHTDHYLPAETCTHRANSKHHSYAYDGFLGGGGPGGQHCYTTGLLWQYLFFADKRAKDKVLQLTNWVRRFYNGSGSLCERTFRFLTIDLKNDSFTMLGNTFAGYRYPLDRGTGNFLVALIDSYEITSDPELIKEMGFVIRNTVHPLDDLNARNLKNVEESWFYTVFFQAVVRYLFLKESIKQPDDEYHYARQTFMHYVCWMVEHEDYYLNKPEILEFPNDTWCAQDIRKANLFYYGYYFSPDKNKQLIKKADAFYGYVKSHLEQSEEAQYTRILSILMQNDGVFQMFNQIEAGTRKLPHSDIVYSLAPESELPRFSKRKLLVRYCKDIFKLLSSFSFKREWNWLKFRLGKLL